MKEIEIWPWEKLGGKYWLIGPFDFGVVFYIKWSLWTVGFQIVKTGIIMFLGPLIFGVATVNDEGEENENECKNK